MARYIPEGLKQLAFKSGALSITFDDFSSDAWRVGGPILAEHGVRATYYISGGLLGTTSPYLQAFDENDLFATHKAGHEIGCHTFDHLSALETPASTFRASILRNREFISKVLPGQTMSTFAYPFGDVSVSAKRYVKRSFKACRGILPGLNGAVTELTYLRAIALEDRHRRTFNMQELVALAAKTKRWLIVFTHDVRPKPSPYGCTPEDLITLIHMARDAGLYIAPVATILEQALHDSASERPAGYPD